MILCVHTSLTPSGPAAPPGGVREVRGKGTYTAHWMYPALQSLPCLGTRANPRSSRRPSAGWSCSIHGRLQGMPSSQRTPGFNLGARTKAPEPRYFWGTSSTPFLPDGRCCALQGPGGVLGAWLP